MANFIIHKQIAILDEQVDGWTTEVNLLSWGDKAAGGHEVIDIRQWAPDHDRMGRGISLSPSQARVLTMRLLRELFERKEDGSDV